MQNDDATKTFRARIPKIEASESDLPENVTSQIAEPSPEPEPTGNLEDGATDAPRSAVELVPNTSRYRSDRGECLILVGDAIDRLQDLPDACVNTVVTSPPYFGLRDYGADGQIGLEPSPEEFVAALVAVFREVRRVLRNDGTVWLNLGDSYAADRGGTHPPAETLAGGERGYTTDGKKVNRGRHDGYNPSRNAKAIGLKHKDLMGIPWRVALALQTDGWYLRQDIIWHKPNPMPESVKDRCTKAHEYVFLLSKSEQYYYDNEVIAEPANPANHRPSRGIRETPPGQNEHTGYKDGRYYKTRNKRSVWSVNVSSYPEAHFATYPPELVEPCILAGCPVGGVVLDPFGGSGTTGAVASDHGRDAILIELNPEYADLAVRRIENYEPVIKELNLSENMVDVLGKIANGQHRDHHWSTLKGLRRRGLISGHNDLLIDVADAYGICAWYEEKR